MKRRLVVLCALAFLQLPAAAQPFADSLRGNNERGGDVRVVATGTGFLAVWPVETTDGPRTDAVALDPQGRRVTDQATTIHIGSREPHMVRMGSGALLTFRDAELRWRFMRLRDDGTPIEELHVGASEPFTMQPQLFATHSGSRVLILTNDRIRWRATLVDGNGRVVSEDVFRGVDAEIGAIVALDDDFLNVNHSDGRIHRILGDGSVRDEDRAFRGPAGAEFRWRSLTGSTNGEVLVLGEIASPTGVSLDAVVIGANGASGSVTIARGSIIFLRTIWSGVDFLVIYQYLNDLDVYVARVAPNGSVRGAPIALDTRGASSIGSIAVRDSTVYMTTAGAERSAGISFDSDLRVRHHDAELTRTPARQAAPSTATDGASILAVWRESTAAAIYVRAALHQPNGRARDVTTLAQNRRMVMPPAVAFGGGMYLVVWVEDFTLMATRILASGVALDTVPFAMSASDGAGPASPIVIWTGKEFVVAWHGLIEVFPTMVTTTVSTAGAVGEVRIAASPSDNDGYREPCALAWNGERFLLAYTSRWHSGTQGLWGSELRTVVLDRERRVIGEPVRHAWFGLKPRVVSDGRRFLMSYERGTAYELERTFPSVHMRQ